MQTERGVATLIGLVVIIAAAVVFFGGVIAYEKLLVEKKPEQVACTEEAKQCPDGSYVGRTGPNCEFAPCPKIETIRCRNEEYGFEITLPKSWEGYSVIKSSWKGHLIEDYDVKYSGVLLILKNSKLLEKKFAGIPIMVVPPNLWQQMSGPDATIAVSAAPIGPARIGQNSKYVFATPPRYIGFADELDAQQIQEVYEIVKTFKAF